MDAIGVPIRLIDQTLDMPRYAYEGDAGLDLRASDDVHLEPFERAAVNCGIAIAIPEGYAGLVIPRSGLAIKHGISVVNAPGLIDSNYRGEIKAILINLDPHEAFEIHHGDRIAQLMVVKAEPVSFEMVDALDSTQRGSGGFGSSGLSA